MNIECIDPLVRRAAVHAALADTTRLRIVDALAVSDCSPSDLASRLGLRSNLLAHHLQTLTDAGVVSRRRSEGDRRRTYVRLIPEALEMPVVNSVPRPRRVLFVCTANSARSQLAAALWRHGADLPADSAGTHPAGQINPGAVAVAARHGLSLTTATPRHLDDVWADGDLVITVCDRAHEELPTGPALHWSVPDPVSADIEDAFGHAYDELATRVEGLRRRVR